MRRISKQKLNIFYIWLIEFLNYLFYCKYLAVFCNAYNLIQSIFAITSFQLSQR